MKFEDVRSHVEGVPFISTRDARILYDFILETKPQRSLELGFAHGASTCYMAAALDELGGGHIEAIDLNSMRDWQKPSIEQLLEKTDLQNYVTPIRENTSYTWYLKKIIEKNLESPEIIDFCYIDGPKNWTVDGCSFFLIDKLLKEGGQILFDDYSWRYSTCKQWNKEKLIETGILVNEMSDDELNTPHVELIYRLLVQTHPNYGEFRVQNENWAWARKIAANRPYKREFIESLDLHTISTKRLLKFVLKRLLQKIGYFRQYVYQRH